MGRKKRKVVELEPANDEALKAYMPPAPDGAAPAVAVGKQEEQSAIVVQQESSSTATSAAATAPSSSSYAVTTHGAEIVGEDLYVSDGSDEDDGGGDDDTAELVLAGSRMGLMRRGLHHHGVSLVQPNRQWHRESATGETTDADKEKEEEQKREEELAKLDPVERAKVLLAEKKRKLEEAEEMARRNESEENAGRDPCLFSKRTAFDIRMDQIEDKPWNNGADLTDYFNYTMTEADWLEYSQLQLQIRQELTDASRQRRPPDPNIVPVTPKTPQKQAPRVAVAVRNDTDENPTTVEADETQEGPEIGPTLVKKEDKMDEDEKGEDTTLQDVSDVGGGAWGAGAAPGSMLAKLIEEQEQKSISEKESSEPNASKKGSMDAFTNRGGGGGGAGVHGSGGGQDQYPPPPPAPPGRGYFPPRGSFRGRGRGGYGPPGGNMPPPWAARGGRGGFRGGYDGGYGGRGHWR